MPKMDAVSSRNCAMMVQFPAAISCASLIASETKAKITATMKEVTAVRYSILRCLDIMLKNKEIVIENFLLPAPRTRGTDC